VGNTWASRIGQFRTPGYMVNDCIDYARVSRKPRMVALKSSNN